MKEGQSLPTPQSPRTTSSADTDSGTLQLGPSGSTYVQSGHWESVLMKIRGLRDQLLDETEPRIGSRLLYQPNRASRDEILAAVPPRSTVVSDPLYAISTSSNLARNSVRLRITFKLSASACLCSMRVYTVYTS